MVTKVKVILINILIMSVFIGGVFAAWVDNAPVQIVQPDGSIINLFNIGDEYYQWLHDQKGYTVVKDRNTGYYCFARVQNEELVSTGFPVHLYNPRNIANLDPFENISEEAYLQKRKTMDDENENDTFFTPRFGTIQNLVVFISFPPGPNHDPITHGDGVFNEPFSVFRRQFFDMSDYFLDSSEYRFMVQSHFYPLQQGTETNSYIAPEERFYYTLAGAGNDYYIQKNRLKELLLGALSYITPLVDPYLDIDSDNDGYIDNIVFIIEGRRDVVGSFWPSMSSFIATDSVSINNKTARNYNVILEETGWYHNVDVRLVHILHEFTHSLGAPDTYGYGNTQASDPVGPWCIMARPDRIPTSMSAYIKNRLGWLDIPTIEVAGEYSLTPFAASISNVVFRINSPFSSEQYFLIEYRRKVPGRFPDSALEFINMDPEDYINIPDPHGLIVYRVYKGSLSYSRLHVYRPTDDVTGLKDSRLGFFSAESNRVSINDTTNPNSLIYGISADDLIAGGLDISNIGSALDTISFHVSFIEPIFTTYVRPGYSHLQNHFDTIQEAFDNVHNNGTVYIYPGVYSGVGNREIMWNNKNLTFTNMFTDNGPVIINCEGMLGFEMRDRDNQSKISNMEIHNAITAIRIKGVSYPIIDNVTFIGSQHGIEGSIGIEIDNSLAPFDSPVLITDCMFDGFTNSGNAIDANVNNLTIKNSIFQNNSGTKGSALNARIIHLHLENNLIQNNTGNLDGASVNIVLRDIFEYTGDTSVKIINNTFMNNTHLGTHMSALRSSNITIYGNYFGRSRLFDTVIVSGNTFLLDDNVSSNARNINMYSDGEIDDRMSNIKFYNNTEYGFGRINHASLYISFASTDLKYIDIKNSVFTGKIDVTNLENKTISNSWFYDVTNPDNPVELYNVLTGFSPQNIVNVFTGNPHLDDSFAPMWTDTVKSGLIDSGYVPDRLSWFNDPEYTDADGTRVDIGIVPTINHRSFLTSLSKGFTGVPTNSSIYSWVCFPVLDKLYTGQDNTIYYELHQYNENNMLAPVHPVLSEILWNTTGTAELRMADDLIDGNDTHIMESRIGYKILTNRAANNDYKIINSGFLCGQPGNPENTMTVYPVEDHEDYKEFWIGYFVPVSSYPIPALMEIEADLVEIKARNWTISRQTVADEWIIPNPAPHLNPGEAISIRYTGTREKSFTWQAFSDHLPNYVHPEPVYFEYTEESDYIPLYVEIPDEMICDDDSELGFFIDDICYGAAVVNSDFLMIPAYILDVSIKEDSDIEFRYYQYDTRFGEISINEYQVYDHLAQSYQTTPLLLKEKRAFYRVSLLNTTLPEIEPDIPSMTKLVGNYPNPFNPSTSIAFDIRAEGMVRIEIYNIRGQKVTTLLDEYKRSGSYTVDWYGTDDSGRKVSSGIYFYRMNAEGYTDIRRMVLLK